MRRLAFSIAPWFTLLFLAGCGGDDDPREVAAAYLDDLARGRFAAAFERLAPDVRARLARSEARWAEGRPDALCPAEDPPKDFTASEGVGLFVRLLAGAPDGVPQIPADAARRVGAAREEGDQALVEITTPLGPRELRLERGEEGWRVVLQLPR